MARSLGNPRNVYVATTAPTDATDPDDAAYTKVGYRTNVGLTSQAQTTPVRDADGVSNFAGENDITNTLAVNYDPTQDDGAVIVRNAHFTSPKPALYYLETSGVVGEEYATYQAQTASYTEAHQVDSAATQSFGLTLTTAPTFGTISA